MSGSVVGYTRDDATLAGIGGVRIVNPWHEVQSASDGFYSIDAENATFNLTADRDRTEPPTPVPQPPPANYYSKTVQVTVNNNTVVVDFYLKKMPPP